MKTGPRPLRARELTTPHPEGPTTRLVPVEVDLKQQIFDVCSSLNNGHSPKGRLRQLCADFVAEIGGQTARDADAIFCSRRCPPAGLCGRLTLYFTDAGTAYAAHKGGIGGGRATNLASLRRFCAIAANVNSNWAPHGPRNRSRPSRRIRFKCANSISTRFLSRDDCLNASVLASARATSRASS